MHHSLQREIGMRLKVARLRSELSQKEAAKAVGRHPVTISKYERGEQDPNTSTLGALARLYGVTTDWLIDEHEYVVHLGENSQEKVMLPIVSYPQLILRIHEGTLSEEAIEDLKDLVAYILWRDRKRHNAADE